ncbi:MAG TPA: flagellar basal body rod protein FlgB [Verrucomicrobiae bacterium]
MIEALFSQPNYVTAKKALDGIALRQQAIASNLANLEKPGYKRLDLAPSFKAELDRAAAAQDAQQIAGLQPTLALDPNAGSSGPNGNNVNFEQEMLALNQNALAHAVETQLVTGALLKLKLAITGKA